jgi:hypothetical protein
VASGAYNYAVNQINENTLDLENDTIKVMLVGTGYTYDPDDDFVSSGAGTPGGEEITATNYTGGFGGAGRKTLTTVTFTEDDANNRSVLDADDPVTWTSLGNGVNDTVAAAIIIKEITNDAASPLIVYVDFTNRTTDGSDFPLLWNTTGIATWTNT